VSDTSVARTRENPIAVDIDRPVDEIIESFFGVLYLAARSRGDLGQI
jgi:hypothetical protein